MKRREKPTAPVAGKIYTDHQRRQVLQARDPAYLRARAAACLAAVNGTVKRHDDEWAGEYFHLEPHVSLRAEAAKCIERATAIEAGESVVDWHVTVNPNVLS